MSKGLIKFDFARNNSKRRFARPAANAGSISAGVPRFASATPLTEEYLQLMSAAYAEAAAQSVTSRHAANQASMALAASPASFSMDITVPGGGFEPLGYDEDGRYVVLSRKTGRVVRLNDRDFTVDHIRMVLGDNAVAQDRQFCQDDFEDAEAPRSISSKSAIADSLKAACDGLGLFNERLIRGTGIYRQGNRLVANLGNLLITSDGKPVELASKEAVYISGAPIGFDASTQLANPHDIQALVDAIKSFSLRNPADAKAMLGWLAMAVFGQVVSHRAILALTAERGSGKTSLLTLFANLLGEQAVRREGIPTESQVIYAIGNRSCAMLVDEFEARGHKAKMLEDFFAVARSSFSSDNGGLSRVSGGTIRYYNPPSGLLLAGISLPAMNSATESRTIRVAMGKLAEGQVMSPSWLLDPSMTTYVQKFGASLRRTLFARWDVMRDTTAAARQMLLKSGLEARTSDKFAPLIGGYVALTQDVCLSAEDLAKLVEEFASTGCEEALSVETDSDICLRVLLDSKVSMNGMRQAPYGRFLTVRDVLREIVSSDAGVGAKLSRQLEKGFGLGVRANTNGTSNIGWNLIVASSPQHQGMRTLLRGTDWANGGWKDVLSRLPGAQASLLRLAGVSSRVVLVPLTKEAIEVSYEGLGADTEASQMQAA